MAFRPPQPMYAEKEEILHPENNLSQVSRGFMCSWIKLLTPLVKEVSMLGIAVMGPEPVPFQGVTCQHV